MDNQFLAFVSCSLRKEDEEFVNIVSSILKRFNVMPFGTVGKYYAAPENPVISMKKNIENSDFVVIAATKRYFTEDVKSGLKNNTLSEMLHTEAGIAFALNKPVIVFVEEGTNVGSFIPNVTQYITIDKNKYNLKATPHLVRQIICNTINFVCEERKKKSWNNIKNFTFGALAVYGGIVLLDNMNNEK